MKEKWKYASLICKDYDSQMGVGMEYGPVGREDKGNQGGNLDHHTLLFVQPTHLLQLI